MAKGDQDAFRFFGVPPMQLDNGIEPSGSSLASEFCFADDVQNVHKAQYDGFGPRYGMSPLPYHSIPVSTAQPSLVDLEGFGAGKEERQRLYGIVPLRLAAYSATGPLGPSSTHYVWMCARRENSVDYLAAYMNTAAGTDPQPYAPLLDGRLSRYTGFIPTSQFTALFVNPLAPLLKQKLGTWSNAFASLAQMTVPGRVIPVPWLLGFNRTDAAGAVPPLAEFDYGYTSEFAYLNQTGQSRSIRVFRIEVNAGQNITRTQYNVTAQPSYYLFRNAFTKNTVDIDGTKVATTGTKQYGVSGSYSNSSFVLYNDDSALHNQRHNIIAVAFGKPYIYAFKEEFTSSFSASGTLPLIPVDPTLFRYAPSEIETTAQAGSGTGNYTENGVDTKTCWRMWPAWVAGTATVKDADLAPSAMNLDVALGAAGSGILRQNTTYEFTYSLYNRAFGHETNVGKPARIETGADDFVSLTIRRSPTDTGTFAGNPLAACPSAASGPFNFAFFASLAYINHFQYRIYYRELGTFEWLPAGQIDAADYHFNATERTRRVCEGAMAALPGGQPGGYNDYSPLPDDEYFQVLTYAGRLFWFSPKAGIFSLKDNPYSYAVRNAFGCPRGAFVGAIVHTYPGEAQQDARLVIFTTEETVAARFRGTEFGIQQPVRVSPDSVGTFYLDGSDFDLRVWTSATAFSHRAAVNAGGILYWWGPDGVYRDEGVDLPRKAWSEYMDPLLTGLYDKAQKARIHGVYNARTREILWFFVASDGTQKALVYNTKGDSFFVFTFANIVVDSAQLLDVELSGAGRSAISGPRVVLMCRDAADLTIPQRGVFFDELVDAGDLRISKAFLCSAVAVQGSGRRLTIAPGFAGSLPTTGSVTLSSTGAYAAASYDGDGIYPITGGNGTSYLDIGPAGAFLPPVYAAAGAANYLPVWVESVHGFPLRAKSEYWAPGGFAFYGRFQYCEQIFRIDRLLRSSAFQIKMEWLSILGGPTANARVLTLTDNYRGSYRVHSHVPFEQENAEGQGISTTWTTPTGLHNGGRWYVQFLAYRAREITEGANRRFEG